MDPVLEALEKFRLTATHEEKASALTRLMEECHSAVDAYQYVNYMLLRCPGSAMNTEFTNYNMNPDYSLDFSLFKRNHAHALRRLCV